MGKVKTKLRKKLEEEFRKQSLGTHMCCLYRNKEEQLSALSSFMSLGTERNEKCLYIVDDRTKEEVIKAFKSLNFEVEKFLKSGQFEFMTKSESYLRNGYFDPDKMIDLLNESQNRALKENYTGLRVTGEMTWFFSDLPGVERLMEYESKLNEFLPDSKVVALCQYNENRFSPKILLDVIHTHLKALIYDGLYENPYYMPPHIFNARLRGEVDREHYENVRNDIINRTKLKREREDFEKRRAFLRNLLREEIASKANIIHGYLALMENGLPGELEGFRWKAEQATRSISDLVRKVEKLEVLEEAEETVWKNLGVAVRDAVEDLEEETGRKGVSVDIQGNLDFGVRAGPLLKDAFFDLMSDFLANSGCDKIKISVEMKDDTAVVSLENNGRSLDDEEKERIFDPFWTSGKKRSTAIGLYLIKRIIENYGGSVEVKNSELGGARFDFRLKSA